MSQTTRSPRLSSWRRSRLKRSRHMSMFEINRVETGIEEVAAPNVSASKGPSLAPRGVAQSTGPALPKFIQPVFERMPLELQRVSNWVLWAAVWNGKKWTKRPIQISGYGASATNPKHWSSFEAAKEAYEEAVARGHMELREKG